MEIKNNILWYLSSLFLAVFLTGFSLSFSEKTKNVGMFIMMLSVAAEFIFVTYFKFKEMQTKNETNLTKIMDSIELYNQTLKKHINKIGLSNDAKFVPDGFIGLQRQTIALESNIETGSNYVRMAVLGHLPSYMRLNTIEEDRGRKLYDNWEPPHYIPEYVKLINQRKEAFNTFIEKGGVAREIYKKAAISEYVKKGFTFHDRINDPIQEIEDRLNALLFYMEKKNYYVCFLEEEISGPSYLLKSNVGLVMDFRTTETDRHFTHSIEGLYTESDKILREFERKFAMIWKPSDKAENKAFIKGLLEELKNQKQS